MINFLSVKKSLDCISVLNLKRWLNIFWILGFMLQISMLTSDFDGEEQ